MWLILYFMGRVGFLRYRGKMYSCHLPFPTWIGLIEHKSHVLYKWYNHGLFLLFCISCRKQQLSVQILKRMVYPEKSFFHFTKNSLQDPRFIFFWQGLCVPTVQLYSVVRLKFCSTLQTICSICSSKTWDLGR